MTSNESTITLPTTFKNYFSMFAKHHNFSLAMAPSTKRCHIPEWFTKEFPPSSPDQEAESNEIWEAFINPKFIITRLGVSKDYVKILC